MNRKFSLFLPVLSILLLCMGYDVASAQLFRRAAPRVQSEQVTQPVAGERMAAMHDVILADWIGADNQLEISVNQFASQRASSPEVKGFAQEMIRAHGEMAQKLNQAVTNANATALPRTGQTPYAAGYRGQPETAPAAPGTPEANPAQGTPAQGSQSAPAPAPAPAANPSQVSPAPAAADGSTAAPAAAAAQTPPPSAAAPGTSEPATFSAGGAAAGQAGVAAATQGGSRLNPATLKRDIDSQFLTLIEQKLGQKQGQDFDRCFMEGQVAAHLNMIATLQAAQNHASAQLRPVLDEGLATAQKHLSEAESLATKLQQSH